MVRFTIVSRIRMLAAITPAVLLLAAPFVAGGLYVFGRQIEALQERELSAKDAARGMDVALYQMEWARTQPERDEILLDQRRAFANSIELARDRSGGDNQRQLIAAIAQLSAQLFEQFRNSSPADQSVDASARNLHGRIADLIDADDSVLTAAAASSRRQAMRLIVVMMVAGLAIPWLCFAMLYATGGALRAELRAIRASFERLRERPPLAPLASDQDLTAQDLRAQDLNAIDTSLARLGFPKPNPMLAE